MTKKGIDVSSFQGKPDWSKVAGSGVEVAILRITELYGTDSSFEHNYKGCKSNGIKVGVYRLSYARTEAQAIKEADDVIAVLNGRGLDFPVVYDLEWEEQINLGRQALTNIINAFLRRIKKAGYKVAIYSNANWCINYFYPDKLETQDFWLASVPNQNYDTGVPVSYLKPSGANMGWQYSWKGKIPGISVNVDMDEFYKDYGSSKEESPKTEKAGVSADTILNIIKSWFGKSMANGTHKNIVDIYNGYGNLPLGYKVQYYDAYCATTVSAAFIQACAVELIGGIECGVERFIQVFKNKGIWNEDGSITPKKGDIICYNWDDSTQPNDGFADHIGIVASVSGGNITVYEGNMGDDGHVGQQTIPVGWGYIRGYARPVYGAETPKEEPKKEVQSNPSAPSKERKFVGMCTADRLNVRSWAGTEYNQIKSWPQLGYGNLVDVCDTVKDKNGADWYYIRIAGQYYGFVHSAYIERK